MPESSSDVRFLLVGMGRISLNHLDAIERLKDDCEIVGFVEIDPHRRSELAAKYQQPVYTDLDQALKESSANVVVLCTPSGVHAEQAIKAAESRRHIVTEKPMATYWSDGRAMLTAAKKNNVKLFVVKQNRYNPTLQLVKKAITGGRFGSIYNITINVFWTRPQSYYDQNPWRGTWQMDGGALMNQASHYIDLLDWLGGPVEKIHCFGATLSRKIQAEDTAVVSVKWRNGALGSVNVTMLTYPKNFEGSLTVLGELGTVRLGGVAINEIQYWQFSDSHPDDELVQKASYETTSVYGFGHRHYYQNLVDHFKGKSVPIVDASEGLKSLEILEACYLSAEQGSEISLPLEAGRKKP